MEIKRRRCGNRDGDRVLGMEIWRWRYRNGDTEMELWRRRCGNGDMDIVRLRYGDEDMEIEIW
mgnify:CR=1 FL=1